jgi:hypothetical protein
MGACRRFFIVTVLVNRPLLTATLPGKIHLIIGRHQRVKLMLPLRSISSKKYFFWSALFLVLIFTALKSSFVAGAGFFTSLIFWAIQVGCLLPLLFVVQDALQSLAWFKTINVWCITTLAGVISSVLFSPFAIFWDYVFAFEDWQAMHSTADVLLLSLKEAMALMLPVSIAWLGVNAPRILQLNFQVAEEADADDEPIPDCHVLSLLPKKIGYDIIYLASELHYLRVVTVNGEALILYSLQTAMNELAEHYDGVQTHRSYWVNKRHVEKMVGNASARQILTKHGQLIPISRRQIKAVKESLAL